MKNNLFIVVGCGGTGSNVIPFLSRMFNSSVFYLLDDDIVEPRNVGRQAYQEFNVGENKAIALARKLNSNFKNEHWAIPTKVTEVTQITDIVNRYEIHTFSKIYLLACVDNNKARLILEKAFKNLLEDWHFRDAIVYIDSGNEDTFGTVITSTNNQKIVRSDIFSMEDAEEVVHCGDEIAEQNEQQYQINLDMALAIAKVVFADARGKKIPTVIKVNGFERNCEFAI